MSETKEAMNAQMSMPRESLDTKEVHVATRDGSEIPVRYYKPKGARDLPVLVLYVSNILVFQSILYGRGKDRVVGMSNILGLELIRSFLM